MQFIKALITFKQDRFLLEPFECDGILVPRYFCFDGNSVPRLLRVFLGQYDYLQASLVHDFLYDESSDKYNLSRKDADVLYRKMLLELGCSKLIAYCAYLALRLFGKNYYKTSSQKFHL